MIENILPCRFCGSPGELDSTAYWVECTLDSCAVYGPTRKTEAEAIAAWNEMQRPAGPSVTWTTTPAGPSHVIIQTPAVSERCTIGTHYGDVGPLLRSGNCTVTIYAERTNREAEATEEPEDKENLPACEVCGEPAICYVQDATRNDFPDHATLAPHGDPHAFCSEHDRESETVDITTWGVDLPKPTEADASPVLSDVARLYNIVEELTGVVATLRTDHEKLSELASRDIILFAKNLSRQYERADRHATAIARMAELLNDDFIRAEVRRILTPDDPPETAETAAAEMPANKGTWSAYLFAPDDTYVAKIAVPHGLSPSMIPHGGRYFRRRNNSPDCQAFDDIENGENVYRPGESDD